MDVNGTRFHLVLGSDDWRAAAGHDVDENVCFSEKRGTITLRPEQFVFPPRTGDRLLTADHRRGAAADRHGNIYWIAESRREIRVLPAGGRAAYRYWPAEPDGPQAEEPTGAFAPSDPAVPVDLTLAALAIVEDQYMVVGALDLPSGDGTTSGLVVFDLPGGGPPAMVPWPADLGFAPIDMAPFPDGGLVILDDPLGPSDTARYWRLDRYLRVCALQPFAHADPADPEFLPKEPSGDDGDQAEGQGSTVPASPQQAAPVAALDPAAIETLPDGSVLILDREGAAGRFEFLRYVDGAPAPFSYGLDTSPPEVEEDELVFECSDRRSDAHEILGSVRGHDIVFVPGEPSRLYLVDEQGDQAFAFLVGAATDSVVPELAYYPLRLFSGKGLVCSGAAAHYDLQERWYPVACRARPRYERSATLVVAPDQDGSGRGLDGVEPGTVWHRLFLDGAIPPGTSVTVESRAADDLVVVERREWRAEPAPYLRSGDAEIPFHSYGHEHDGGEGTWELLFQKAVGRYLQIRLTLRGDGLATPQLWALRAYYPRFSYLDRYLPDVYQEDPASASFLDRYLANVEGQYTAFEGRVAQAQWLLDPETTDPAYLDWLADWIGAVIDADWEEERRRLFVRFAARMFTRRGTKRGLREAIRLATEDVACLGDHIFEPDVAGETPFGVRIVETFRTRSTAGVVFGDATDLAGPRLTAPGDRWVLADGGARLEQLYRAFLADRYGVATDDGGDPTPAGRADLIEKLSVEWGDAGLAEPTALLFPPLTPADGARRSDWLDFTRSTLQVAYAEVGSAEDGTAYRAYLAQRYRRVDDYSLAWNLQGDNAAPSFAAITLPVSLPADGAPLQDWIQFVSMVLPIGRSAHRFSVLVPISPEDSDAARQLKLGKVERVVAADRPGHTEYGVKPYWGLFRVGEARVGYESVVGERSRYYEIVLGDRRLAAGYLTGRAWDVDNRLILGRDRIETTGAAAAASDGNGGTG